MTLIQLESVKSSSWSYLGLGGARSLLCKDKDLFHTEFNINQFKILGHISFIELFKFLFITNLL